MYQLVHVTSQRKVQSFLKSLETDESTILLPLLLSTFQDIFINSS